MDLKANIKEQEELARDIISDYDDCAADDLTDAILDAARLAELVVANIEFRNSSKESRLKFFKEQLNSLAKLTSSADFSYAHGAGEEIREAEKKFSEQFDKIIEMVTE